MLSPFRSSNTRRFAFALSAALLCASAPRTAAAQAPDASSILAQAKAEAAPAHKNILLVFSASWCGPCHLFERFLQDPQVKPIIDKAFVITRLDVGERPADTRHADTPGAVNLRASLGGGDAGYPFLAITDPAGKPLINSLRPDKGHTTNIGYPDSPAEIDWFNQMLQKAAPNLSAAEIATLRQWLQVHSSERH